MKKKFYRDAIYHAALLLRGFFSLFPYEVGFSCAGALGKAAYVLLPRERKRMLSHLRTAFGNEKSDRELRKIARAVFEHYGQTAGEMLLLDRLIKRLDEYVTVEGTEHLDRAARLGHGVIGLVAHFGNWELMGGYLSLRGYPMTAIARKIYHEKYNDLLMSMRKKVKVETIYRDGSIRRMLAVLKSNKILVIAGDQDVDSVDGVFVSFFGKPAFTPVAPVRFAMATGAPILTAYIIRNGPKHRIIIQPPLDLEVTGDKERDLKINTQKWVSDQEAYIRRHPHLWAWNHRRWKTAKAS